MDGKIKMICRILAACALGVFLVQGAMAAPAQRESKAADRTLRTELKALHQQERASKSPAERSAIRAQMKEKRHQARMAKNAQHISRTAQKGVK